MSAEIDFLTFFRVLEEACQIGNDIEHVELRRLGRLVHEYDVWLE
jgi:hypothetical protein